ncbi:MAG: TolB family protein [Bacteroidota bacterium]
MKNKSKRIYFPLFLLFLRCMMSAATEPEVYLIKLNGNIAEPQMLGYTTLSAHPAYDNPPLIDEKKRRILFVSARDGNTELYAFSLVDSSLQRLTYNNENEYSPSFIPGTEFITVVKGKEQRLAMYKSPEKNDSTLILHPDSVAYYQWSENGLPVTNMLDKNRSILIFEKPDFKSHRVILKRCGRTIKPYRKGMLLCEVPTDTTACTSVIWTDLKNAKETLICLPQRSEDFGVCGDMLFCSSGKKILQHSLLRPTESWKEAFMCEVPGLTKITRMVFSSDFLFAVMVVMQ